MCMEGIEQNPVVYELMSEMAFRNQKVQVLVIYSIQMIFNYICFPLSDRSGYTYYIDICNEKADLSTNLLTDNLLCNYKIIL